MEDNYLKHDLEQITLEDKSNTKESQELNLDSNEVYHKRFGGYKLNGKDVYSILAITRKDGKLEFQCYFRYMDNSPVLKEGRKEINFAKYRGLDFDCDSLKSYSNKNRIDVPLSEKYIELQKQRQSLEDQLEAFYKTPGIGTETKSRKSRPIKNKIKDTFEEIHSEYAESALRKFGHDWLKGFEDKIRNYIETDGRPVNEGGNGNGPYLQNWLHMHSLPKTSCVSPRTYPGCFGTSGR